MSYSQNLHCKTELVLILLLPRTGPQGSGCRLLGSEFGAYEATVYDCYMRSSAGDSTPGN